MLLKNLIELKINILLEGPTGTAKTLSAEIICDLLEHIKQKEKGEKYKKKEIIKFNLSSETTIPDLLGRYIGDKKSWGGIILKEGPFKGQTAPIFELNANERKVFDVAICSDDDISFKFDFA